MARIKCVLLDRDGGNFTARANIPTTTISSKRGMVDLCPEFQA
jgi:hypothetical protein